MLGTYVGNSVRRFFALPLRVHLLFLVLLSVLPALIIIIHNSLSHRTELEQSVTEQSISLVQSIVSKQRSTTESAKQLLATIARLPAAKNKNAVELSGFFEELVKQSPLFVNILAADRTGVVFASGLPMGSISAADRKYFKDAMSKKDFSVGEYTKSRTTGLPAIHFAYPILDYRNDVDVVLVAVVDIRGLQEVFGPLLENIGTDIVVSDHHGIVIYASEDLKLKPGSADPYQPHIYYSADQLNKAVRMKPKESQEYLLANSALVLPGETHPYMYFRASFDLTSLLAEEREYLFDSLKMLALATSLSLLMAWIFGNALIVRRLQRFVKAAQKLSRGNLGYRVSNSVHGAEFHSLAAAFDEMAQSLELREQENRKFQDELQRTARLESLGILAGGIAHDFNNLLMAISANISLLQFKRVDSSEGREVLTGLELAVQRAKDLTLQLLTFSKGGKPLKKSSNIAELISNSANFVLRGNKHGIEVRSVGLISPIEVDEGQVSQVIGNLVINASQAMEEPGVIKILISKQSFFNTSEPRGVFLRIDVIDEGPGISQQQLAKVFDPFFTTKKTGHGLGLTSSHSIVKNHGGWMEAKSTLGAGSVFTFFLPVNMADEVEVLATRQELEIMESKNILIMDDDETLRELMGRMVSCLSHRVTVAANGEQAIEIYRNAIRKKDPFDVVILDLTVRAGLGGRETMTRLKAEFPLVRAIAASGFATDDILANYENYGFSSRLAKPFKIDELQKTIVTVCSEGRTIPSAIAS